MILVKDNVSGITWYYNKIKNAVGQAIEVFLNYESFEDILEDYDVKELICRLTEIYNGNYTDDYVTIAFIETED